MKLKIKNLTPQTQHADTQILKKPKIQIYNGH